MVDSIAKDDIQLAVKAERFSPALFSIVILVHILGLGGIFFVSMESVLAWACAHLYFSTFGVALGLHRYFSHRSYNSREPLTTIVAITSTLCFQGGPIFWAAAHKMHHRFTEGYGDPHSAGRGFMWSHIQWMFYRNPNGFSYSKAISSVRDLRANRMFALLERHSTTLNVGTLALLFVVSLSLGRLDLFFWLGPIRILSVWHATWLINSYAHRASFFRKAITPVSLRSSHFMSLILGGEGDHNYHHKHPSIPRHSANRFHLDYSYWLLVLFRKMHLVTFREPIRSRWQDIKVSPSDQSSGPDEDLPGFKKTS